MRIAVCISGQLRTWAQCYDSWMNLFDINLIKSKILHTIRDIGYRVDWLGKVHSDLNPLGKSIIDVSYILPGNLDPTSMINTYNDLTLNPIIEIDYFVHTWDFNTVSNSKNIGIPSESDTVVYSISESEMKLFNSTVNPKKICIEGRDVSDSKFQWGAVKPLLGWSRSQFYGISEVSKLKAEYEIEHDFTYDICVRLRPDLFFSDKMKDLFLKEVMLPKDNLLYGIHCGKDEEFPYSVVGDIFYYANSKTYDIISDFYTALDDMDGSLFSQNVKPELVFSHYLTENNIGVYSILSGVEIKRRNKR